MKVRFVVKEPTTGSLQDRDTNQRPIRVVSSSPDENLSTCCKEDCNFSTDGLTIEKCYKDLTPRELNQVNQLEIFLVLAKIEYVGEKKTRQAPILFYKDGETQEDLYPDERPRKWLKRENSQPVPAKVLDGFKKELVPLFQKLQYPDQATADLSQKMWNAAPSPMKRFDGTKRCIKGIGYHRNRRRIRMRKPYEHFWNVHNPTYLRVKGRQTQEMIYKNLNSNTLYCLEYDPYLVYSKRLHYT